MMQLSEDDSARAISLLFALGLYSFVLLVIDVLVLILLSFHVYLIFINQTTYHRIKNFYKKWPYSPNPYARKSFCHNLSARIRQQMRADSVIELLISVANSR